MPRRIQQAKRPIHPEPRRAIKTKIKNMSKTPQSKQKEKPKKSSFWYNIRKALCLFWTKKKSNSHTSKHK